MIGYIGGKTRLARQLIALFPSHTTYVEPFAGMAHVLFAKPPSQCEVLNDLNDDVVNVMRVCQLHHGELCRYLKFTIASRRLFEVYQKQDPATLTDVQRAARFLYLHSAAFGGKVVGRTFTLNFPGPPPCNAPRLTRLIDMVARRLELVTLECRPYEAILERFDSESTLFFCDPPYVGTHMYPSNFSEDDYRRLAAQLAQLRGRFVLSLNDHPLARSIFGHFNSTELFVRYSLRPQSQYLRREVVFTNYDLPQAKPALLESVDNCI